MMHLAPFVMGMPGFRGHAPPGRREYQEREFPYYEDAEAMDVDVAMWLNAGTLLWRRRLLPFQHIVVLRRRKKRKKRKQKNQRPKQL